MPVVILLQNAKLIWVWIICDYNHYFHCFYSINGDLNGSSNEYLHDQSMSLSDMFQIFQTDIREQVSLFSSKLDLFITTIDSLELRQKKLEDQMNSVYNSGAASSTPSDTSKRQRLTPTSTQILTILIWISVSLDSIQCSFCDQSRIRQLHNSFDDEKQFRSEEMLAIDGIWPFSFTLTVLTFIF